MYENVADRINYREFFDEFGMPDTFNSWFLVTELHCWMLLTRVMGEGDESGQDGRFLRNCIVEAMWADVQTRAKKLSQDNPSASRAQVQVLSEQFQATLINYDEGRQKTLRTNSVAQSSPFLFSPRFNERRQDSRERTLATILRHEMR